MSINEGEVIRNLLEEREERDLIPCALKSKLRKRDLGDTFREHVERTPLEYRTEYHRDRDRIIWSRSFKRLQHKTQVFPHYAQDHYRRRLTHSLEVAQIATTLARALGLNEVAAEAIALGHDLGHAPFGHAGESALNTVLNNIPVEEVAHDNNFLPIRGFDHCVHGVEVVSRIEKEYEKPGLNLTFDVRDGILKHMFDRDDVSAQSLSKIGNVVEFEGYRDFKDNKGSLEAQCVYFADKAAYLFGDIEDAIRCGIFDFADLNSDVFLCRIQSKHNDIRGGGASPEINDMESFLRFRRAALATLILDCIGETKKQLREVQFDSAKDVLASNKRIVFVSQELMDAWGVFHKEKMEKKLFENHDVRATNFKAEKIVKELFKAFCEDNNLITGGYRDNFKCAYTNTHLPESAHKYALVRNYVAGMTDAYATEQHARLFMSSERVRFT